MPTQVGGKETEMNASAVRAEYNPVSEASYENAYTTLKARYAEQGVVCSARQAAAEVREREMKTMQGENAAYRCGQIMEHDYFDRYRSGAAANEAYMTVEDAKKLFSVTTGREAGKVARNCGKVSADELKVRPAAPYRVLETREEGSDDAGFSGNRELVIDGERRVAAKVEREESVSAVRMRQLAEKAKKWFPSEDVEKTRGVKTLGSPVAGIALVLVFALVLTIPIMLNVMINNTTSEIGELQKELRALDAEADELRVELEKKNDLRVIEEAAINQYGMIRLDQTTFRYLRLKNTDMIEKCTTEEKSGSAAVLALLSALGIRVGNE